MQDPGQDFAFLNVEPYPEFKSNSPLNQNQTRFWRISDQLSFPAGHLFDHFLFGTFKNTVLYRDIVYNGQRLNDGPLQRYWLSGGIFLLESPKQSSAFIAGVGINSDFADLGPKDWNSEWIYTYKVQLNSKFQCGLGIDLQHYFGKPHFFPLIFLDWRLSEKVRFNWDADYLEIRWFLNRKLALTAGARFNLEFFALKQNASYEYRSGGVETGMQYAVGNHFYLRFKYKELLWGREIVGLPTGSLVDTRINSGGSLRLNLAYGI